jgi:hypothetical protein
LHYYYDINALSNFVADAENVVRFDPWVTFVDYLEKTRRREDGKTRTRRAAGWPVGV